MENAVDFLLKSNDLQKTKRYGNYPPFWESTSEHTFKLVLMVDYFYKELALDLDYAKCIRLALYHDFGEMDLETDIDIKEKADKDVHRYKDMIEKEKIDELSKRYYAPIGEYYGEYREKQTEEAMFVNACDKLEALIHPLTVDSPIMNHELFATYGDNAVSKFPKLLPFYKEIKAVMKKRFEELGFEWRKEYEEIFGRCK